MAESCPPECNIQLNGIKEKLASHDQKLGKQASDILTAHDKCVVALQRDYKHWEIEMGKRAKTSTLIALTVIVVGVLSGMLSGIWYQLAGHERKMDLIRHDQIKVMTTLELHRTEAKHMEGHDKMPSTSDLLKPHKDYDG